MAKSTRVTGNDQAAADPGGTRPKPGKSATASEKVQSGDRNDKPAKSETRIAKKK